MSSLFIYETYVIDWKWFIRLHKPATPTWSEINRIKVGPYGTNHIIPTAIFRQNYPLEHIYRLPGPATFCDLEFSMKGILAVPF